jgi:hypothetical protein
MRVSKHGGLDPSRRAIGAPLRVRMISDIEAATRVKMKL